MRLVLDTDAIVAAMRSPGGASAALLRATVRREVTMVASVPLAIDFEARRANGDPAAFDRLMRRPGGEAPRAGDELPDDLAHRFGREMG